MLNVSGLFTEYVSDKGAVVKAAQDISFEVPEGKLFTLLGPSGCGKTTTLRSIAGLEKPTSGTIEVNGVPVYSSRGKVFIPPNKRDFGMVLLWLTKGIVYFPFKENQFQSKEEDSTPIKEEQPRAERILWT